MLYGELTDTESGSEKVSQPRTMAGYHIYTVDQKAVFRKIQL